MEKSAIHRKGFLLASARGPGITEKNFVGELGVWLFILSQIVGSYLECHQPPPPKKCYQTKNRIADEIIPSPRDHTIPDQTSFLSPAEYPPPFPPVKNRRSSLNPPIASPNASFPPSRAAWRIGRSGGWDLDRK